MYRIVAIEQSKLNKNKHEKNKKELYKVNNISFTVLQNRPMDKILIFWYYIPIIKIYGWT